MAVVRNNNGKIVRGQGAELTELQTQFIDRIAEEGMECSSKIARELNYTSYYRDRRTVGTAFHRELMAIANAEMKSIEAAKGTNLTALIKILFISALAIAISSRCNAVPTVRLSR